MKNKIPADQLIGHYMKQVTPARERFIRRNLQVAEHVVRSLEEKGWSQKEFASRLGKHESEVSKWLTGTHNFTLKSINLMEEVLDEEILLTLSEARKKFSRTEYITLKVHATRNKSRSGSIGPDSMSVDFKSKTNKDEAA